MFSLSCTGEGKGWLKVRGTVQNGVFDFDFRFSLLGRESTASRNSIGYSGLGLGLMLGLRVDGMRERETLGIFLVLRTAIDTLWT